MSSFRTVFLSFSVLFAFVGCQSAQAPRTPAQSSDFAFIGQELDARFITTTFLLSSYPVRDLAQKDQNDLSTKGSQHALNESQLKDSKNLLIHALNNAVISATGASSGAGVPLFLLAYELGGQGPGLGAAKNAAILGGYYGFALSVGLAFEKYCFANLVRCGFMGVDRAHAAGQSSFLTMSLTGTIIVSAGYNSFTWEEQKRTQSNKVSLENAIDRDLKNIAKVLGETFSLSDEKIEGLYQGLRVEFFQSRQSQLNVMDYALNKGFIDRRQYESFVAFNKAVTDAKTAKAQNLTIDGKIEFLKQANKALEIYLSMPNRNLTQEQVEKIQRTMESNKELLTVIGA